MRRNAKLTATRPFAAINGDRLFAAMNATRTFAAAALCALTLAGCDHQRDLWIRGTSLLEVEGDWVPSLGIEDMSGRATARFYPASGDARTEYFAEPRRVDSPVEEGLWNVLIFNGTMFSEQETNLERITFRNTASVGTFEAVVASAEPLSPNLSVAEGEKIAANDMELLTAAAAEVEVDAARGFKVKYINGIDQHPTPDSYVDTTIVLTPRLLNYYAKVVVQMTSADNASTTCSAAVRGFVGSAMMASADRGADRVTHQVRLEKLMVDPTTDVGSVESAPFVTFGPPVPARADWKFELEVSITSRDGNVTRKTFDVADQIAPVVERMVARTFTNSQSDPILIVVKLDLPELEAGVELDNWDDGSNIVVDIRG